MPTEKEQYPVKLKYRLDSFLMYLIQDVTKRPSAEIINFFHELSTQIAELGQLKRTGTGIHKKIDDYFPGTSIPFHLELEGRPNREYDYKTRQYTAAEKFVCQVYVSFPDRPTYIEDKVFEEIGTLIMERALLGVDLPDSLETAPFKRPEVKSPKMYKALMDHYAGRPTEETTARKKRAKKNERTT